MIKNHNQDDGLKEDKLMKEEGKIGKLQGTNSNKTNSKTLTHNLNNLNNLSLNNNLKIPYYNLLITMYNFLTHKKELEKLG